MQLTCKQLNPGPCKTYQVGNDETNEIILIDPVIEHVADYRSIIRNEKTDLKMVVDTHTHADHISGGASLKDIFSCTYAMHAASPVKCADLRFNEGFSWKLFGRVPVKVLYSPGHTRDSVSFIFPDWIFTGDALFLDDGGAGRDDLPGGDPVAHYETLLKLRELPDELMVFPAHDYRKRNPSSLGLQKKNNPHMVKCTEGREAFVQYLEDLKLGPADWMKDVLKVNYSCARNPRAAWIPTDSPSCEVKGTLNVSANEVEIGSIPQDILYQKLNDDPPPVLLDVREKDELTGPLGHIEGIINIPIGSLSRNLDKLQEYRDREIVAVCRSGGRASTAVQILTVAGFRRVLVLEGGMIAWNDRKRQESYSN